MANLEPLLCGRRNQVMRMSNDRAQNKLLERMFEAIFKQRFSQFAKKYGQESVVQTWAAIVKSGGVKAHLRNREWNTHTKIIDALDYLDGYCDSVEPVIQQRVKRGVEKKSLHCQNIKIGQEWGESVLTLMKKHGMKWEEKT